MIGTLYVQFILGILMLVRSVQMLHVAGETSRSGHLEPKGTAVPHDSTTTVAVIRRIVQTYPGILFWHRLRHRRRLAGWQAGTSCVAAVDWLQGSSPLHDTGLLAALLPLAALPVGTTDLSNLSSPS